MWETGVDLTLMSHHTVRLDKNLLYRTPHLLINHGVCWFDCVRQKELKFVPPAEVDVRLCFVSFFPLKLAR